MPSADVISDGAIVQAPAQKAVGYGQRAVNSAVLLAQAPRPKKRPPAPTPTRPAHVVAAERRLRTLFSARSPKAKRMAKVVIRDMADNKTPVKNGGFQAWTNSATEVFVDVSAHDPSDPDILHAVMHHEALHVEQFHSKGRPLTYKAMVDFEISAYGASAKYARNVLKSRAIEAVFVSTVTTLKAMDAAVQKLPSNQREAEYKKRMIGQQMLPPHQNLADLYKKSP